MEWINRTAEHDLFYYSYASLLSTQLPLLEVAVPYFDSLVILDPVGASWDTVGADYIARDAIRLLKDAGIPEIVTPATVLAKYEAPIADGIRHAYCTCYSWTRSLGGNGRAIKQEKTCQIP